MWPVSPAFLTALASSHTVAIDATVHGVDGRVAPVLVDSGSVRVDTGSAVRRQLDAVLVDPDGSTSRLRGLVKADGCEVSVRRGIVYPSGRAEMVPVGRFRVDIVEDDLSRPGAVKVTAPDRMARVADDRFQAPTTGSTGVTYGVQIARLIVGAVPGAVVDDQSGATVTIRPGIVWERDRIDAVLDLARSIGCEVFADPVGGFVVRRQRSLSDPSDWLVAAGVRGVLLEAQRAVTRESVRNAIRADGATVDGEPPVYAVAQDDSPGSPTYVGGPFGRVTGFYSSPLLQTRGQCLQAAQTILARSVGTRASLTLAALVNPALEGGDRIDVYLPDGSVQRHVVDGFTIPLDVSSGMPVSTRAAADVADNVE